MFWWYLVAFTNPVCHSLANIIDAFLTNHSFKSVSAIIFYARVTAVFLILPFVSFITIAPIPTEAWGWIIAMATIEILYLFPYFFALKRMDTSIVAAMFSLGTITVPVLAFFIVEERLQTTQYFGFAIVMIFNILLGVSKTVKLDLNKGFWLMLFASLLCAINAVIYKKILEYTDWITLAVTSVFLCFFISCFFLIVPKMRQDIIGSFGIWKKSLKLFVPMEIVSTVGTIGTMCALSYIPVSVNETICATQPIFALLFGILLFFIFGDRFKENTSKRSIVKKLICFAFIILGVALTIAE